MATDGGPRRGGGAGEVSGPRQQEGVGDPHVTSRREDFLTWVPAAVLPTTVCVTSRPLQVSGP